MSQRFIEVTAEHPTKEAPYPLLLQIAQIVEIHPELIMETESKHEPVAIVTLSNGDTLTLINTYASLVAELDEVNMLVRP